jgi:hypothetical protein
MGWATAERSCLMFPSGWPAICTDETLCPSYEIAVVFSISCPQVAAAEASTTNSTMIEVLQHQ